MKATVSICGLRRLLDDAERMGADSITVKVADEKSIIVGLAEVKPGPSISDLDDAVRRALRRIANLG